MAFVSFLTQVYSVVSSVPRLVFMSCTSLSFSNHRLRFPYFRISLVGKDYMKTSFFRTYFYVILILLKFFVKIEKPLIEYWASISSCLYFAVICKWCSNLAYKKLWVWSIASCVCLLKMQRYKKTAIFIFFILKLLLIAFWPVQTNNWLLKAQ